MLNESNALFIFSRANCTMERSFKDSNHSTTFFIVWSISLAERLNLIKARLISFITSLTIGSFAKEFSHPLTIFIPLLATSTTFSNILVIRSFSASQSLKATITSPMLLVMLSTSKPNVSSTDESISKPAFKAPPTMLVRMSNIAMTPLNVLFNLLAALSEIISFSEKLCNASRKLYKPEAILSVVKISPHASRTVSTIFIIASSEFLMVLNRSSRPLNLPMLSTKSSILTSVFSIEFPVFSEVSPTRSIASPAFISASIVA